MNELREVWEYYVEHIPADALQRPEFVQQFYPAGKLPKYAIQAIMPRLNELGELGWELLQAQPVKIGNNGDVAVNGGEMRDWTNVYMCFFRRRRI